VEAGATLKQVLDAVVAKFAPTVQNPSLSFQVSWAHSGSSRRIMVFYSQGGSFCRVGTEGQQWEHTSMPGFPLARGSA
jgi:hypothetical protein